MTGAVLFQVLLSAVVIAVAIVIQVAGFTLIVRLLRRMKTYQPGTARKWQAATLGLVTYLLFLLHLIQIFVYALVYYATGAIGTLRAAVYFSAATFTTIGGGAVHSEEHWQLFAALQGLSGIVLVGASVSFLVAVVHRMHFWDPD